MPLRRLQSVLKAHKNRDKYLRVCIRRLVMHLQNIVTCYLSQGGYAIPGVHLFTIFVDTPAHQALRCHVDMTLGRPPDRSCRRRPGRPSNRWLGQLHRDNKTPPGDLWRRAFSVLTWTFAADATVPAQYASTTTIFHPYIIFFCRFF